MISFTTQLELTWTNRKGNPSTAVLDLGVYELPNEPKIGNMVLVPLNQEVPCGDITYQPGLKMGGKVTSVLTLGPNKLFVRLYIESVG